MTLTKLEENKNFFSWQCDDCSTNHSAYGHSIQYNDNSSKQTRMIFVINCFKQQN